jgi:hypothetical protein
MVNVHPDSNFEYPLLHSKASQRINPLPQTIKGNCYFYWFVTEFGEDQHISILTENYCQEKNSFPLAIHSVINHNRGRHSREGGNPGGVPVKTGNQNREELDARLRTSGMTGR